MTILTKRLNQPPTERRRKVQQRAKALIAEESSHRDLRKGRRSYDIHVQQLSRSDWAED